MGEAADFLTDEGIEGILAHRRGDCAVPCIYCEEEMDDLDLERFDNDARPVAQEPPRAPSPYRWHGIHNGTFTVTLPNHRHRTYRIHTQPETAHFAPGKRVLSVLVGPDNRTDYRQLAFVSDRGLSMWTRYQGTKWEQYAELLVRLMFGEQIEGHSLRESRRCRKCNRLLSTPESCEKGIGPECERQ
jgi:hypothetical protein